jgi:outer membrane receptor protein involved in Fe transport
VLLPMLHIENMNLRGVYTQTIGRPTFREIAPYETFEFQGDLFFEGNENLRMARITNLDLRWEWFFNPGEIVAVSAFYKRFVDPIQRTIDQGRAGDNLVYTVFNAPVAKVQGLEFEFRYGFGIIDNWLGYNTGVFTDIKLGSNLSLVDSKVNRTEAEKQEDRDNGKSNPDDTRPFAGQSPVLLNINLSYDNYESKTTAGLYYNFFGDRLYQITRQGTPDIYERGYGSLDFKASQGIGEQFSISLSIKNILNPDEIFSYRLDNGVVNKDYVFRKIKRGVTTSLSVAFKL